MYIVRLQDGVLDASKVGGKAASLAHVIQHGVTVPPGFVVTTQAHREHLESRAAGAAAIAPDVGDQIAEALSRFPDDGRFAVRSSAVFEDLTDASFAGQYDTLLDVPKRDVIDAVRSCWTSAANPHAHRYAKERGIRIDQGHMAVIVQALVAAEVSGVSFSLHPVTGADQVVINAAYGLGEAVVSGIVTPDTYVVDKTSHQIERMLGDKECMVVPREGGGTQTVDTPAAWQRRFSLDAGQVEAVHRLTLVLEGIAGYPVDIEWAFAEQTLYCLQMRPVAHQGVMHG